MASNQELFGDDSSSDDDDSDDEVAKDKQQKKDSTPATDAAGAEKMSDGTKEEGQPKKETAKATSASDAGLEDSDDSDDDDGGNKKEKQRKRVLADSDDDDDDEGDVEFDDANADLTGESAPANRKIQATKQQADYGRVDGANSDEDAEGRGGENRRDAPPPPPSVEKWTMPEVPKAAPFMVITKLPNLVGIQTQAFDAHRYDADEEDEIYGVPNLLRWKYKDPNDPSAGLLSNTRLVQWEDDSWTLHIGGGAGSTMEAFEVDALETKTQSGFAGINGYLYTTSIAQSKPVKEKKEKKADGDNKDSKEEEDSKSDDDADDADDDAPVKDQTVLESLSPFVNRWTIRPSLQSQSHKALTLAVRQRTLKTAKIANIATQHDPEKLKQERIQNKKDLDKTMGGGGRAGGMGGGRRNYTKRPRKSRDYLEDDRDFDTTNLRALKRGEYDEDDDDYDDYGGAGVSTRSGRGGRGERSRYNDDEEDDDQVFNKGKKKKSASSSFLTHGDDDDESSADDMALGDDDDDDDEDEGFLASKKNTNKKRTHHQAVLDDDDDSD